MCNGCLKECEGFLSLFFKVFDQTGMQASIEPRLLKLLRSWSYKHLHFHVTIRCHQGILRVMLYLSTIPMYKGYTMYANCEQVHLKGTLGGNLSHKMSTNSVSSTQSLTPIPNEFRNLYLQSPITVSGKVEEVIHCIMSLISLK